MVVINIFLTVAVCKNCFYSSKSVEFFFISIIISVTVFISCRYRMCSMLKLWKDIIFICSIIYYDAAHYIFEIWIFNCSIFLRIFKADIPTLWKIYLCQLPIFSANVAFPICCSSRNAKNMVCKSITVKVCHRNIYAIY